MLVIEISGFSILARDRDQNKLPYSVASLSVLSWTDDLNGDTKSFKAWKDKFICGMMSLKTASLKHERLIIMIHKTGSWLNTRSFLT